MTILRPDGEPEPMPTDIRPGSYAQPMHSLDVSGGSEIISIDPEDLEPGYHGEGQLADFDPGSGRSSWDDWD